MPGTKAVLKQLFDTVSSYKNERGPVLPTNAGFQYDVFWRDAEVSSQVLSKNFTQLALMFSQDPDPPDNEVNKLVNSVTTSLKNFLDICRCVPCDHGDYFNNCLWENVDSVLQGIQGFLTALRKSSVRTDLQPVGVFWDAIEKIPKLPKNNCEALIVELQKEYDMVEDAVSEMKSTVSEQKDAVKFSDPDDVSSEKQELNLFLDIYLLTRLTLELLKVTLCSIKKNGKVETVSQINDYNRIGAASIKNFSKSTDDVVSSLCQPLEIGEVNQCLKEHFELLDNYYKVLTECHFMMDEQSRITTLIFNKIESTKASINQTTVDIQLESLSIDETISPST